MPFSRKVRFEIHSKSDWFFADVDAFIHLWSGSTLLVFLLLPVMVELTISVDMFALLRTASAEVLWVFVVSSLLPWFWLVFIRRRNFFIIGKQRDFRYLCRWF